MNQDEFQLMVGRLDRIAEEVGARRRKVLVVDDDEGIRELVKSVLRRKRDSLEPICVGTAAEAERVLREGGVDFLILDEILPDERGTALAARLIQEGVLRCPTMLISGMASPDERQKLSDRSRDIQARLLLFKEPGMSWFDLPDFIEQVLGACPRASTLQISDLPVRGF